MLTKLRQRMAKEESGFTLVELLVVMLIIGLLAAIAIPSFFNQRDKAKDADAKSTVRTAQTAIETYATDHDGMYTGATTGELETIEQTLKDRPGTLTTSVTDSGRGYTITASSKTNNTFTIDRDGTTGQVVLSCKTGGKGGCLSNERWSG